MAFFDFLKPVEHAVGAAANTTFHFLAQGVPGVSQTQQIQQQATKQINAQVAQLPADTQQTAINSPQYKALQKPFSNPVDTVKNLAVATVRAPIRAGATVGKSIADVVDPALGLPKLPAYDPSGNPVSEALLGKEPVKSFQQRESETQKTLSKSRFRDVAAPFAFLGTAASLGLDATPLGKGKAAAEGLEKLGKNVEMVPTDELTKYMQHDRAASPLMSKESYATLKADIAKNGIKEPLILNYGAKDSVASLGEGNHRLAIAKELGIKELPVEVTGTQANVDTLTGKGYAKVPGAKPDQYGYVPSNQKPSDIGVKTSTKITTDDLHALSNAHTPKDAQKALDGIVDPATAGRIAPAIAKTKDPGIIDNMLQRVSNPAPEVRAVDTTVPPPIIPKEAPKPVKGDARVGEETLRGIANMSNGIEEFGQKLSQLPEDPHIRAAMEKSGAANPQELYHSLNPDPFRDILGAVTGKPASAGQTPVKGIESLRNEQNALLSKERGQRFGNSAAAGAEQAGSAGYFAEKAALKGEYTKIPHEPLISDVGPERAEELFSQARDKILATPDHTYQELGLHPGGARLNTQTAVRKVLGLEPGLPTTSEIKLLKVFSPSLAQTAEAARPRFHQLMDFAAKVFGSFRGIKSTADFSMGGRQGLFVSARHPVEWGMANKESVKYAGSGKYFGEHMQQIASDPWVKVGDQHDLQLPAASFKPEEQYAGSDLLVGHVAKDILKIGNVVAGAERAYNGGLTYLRAAVWKNALQKYGDTPEAAAAALGDKGMRGLAEAINTLTGRGGKDNGFVTKHINTLAEALFSPRLWAARLEPLNPKFWVRIGPAGRAEAMQSLSSFAAVASVVLGAAAAAGGVVETDPRSSDFLKVKFGDTRYDILGGFQQNLVFGWRELTGEKKSSTTGAVTKFAKGVPDFFEKNPLPVNKTFGGPNRLSIASDLAGNKLNPALAAGASIAKGTDAAGQPVNPYTTIGQLFVPISIQGTYQTIRSTGSVPEGILKNSPDFFGVGSQTYGVKDLSVTKKQAAYIKDLQAKGAPADKIAASKLFFQTIKTVPAKNYAYGQIDQAIKQGDIQKATKLAKDYNTQFSKAFEAWRKQYPQYRNDPTLSGSYISRQITGDELQLRIDRGGK